MIFSKQKRKEFKRLIKSEKRRDSEVRLLKEEVKYLKEIVGDGVRRELEDSIRIRRVHVPLSDIINALINKEGITLIHSEATNSKWEIK